ncbi:hypothetical protein C8R44DRAFT_733397 [Mycena epipterygia]|nr:hypothetical protein C8R44DRAFT_733397 [Mycena epipterygia]
MYAFSRSSPASPPRPASTAICTPPRIDSDESGERDEDVGLPRHSTTARAHKSLWMSASACIRARTPLLVAQQQDYTPPSVSSPHRHVHVSPPRCPTRDAMQCPPRPDTPPGLAHGLAYDAPPCLDSKMSRIASRTHPPSRICVAAPSLHMHIFDTHVHDRELVAVHLSSQYRACETYAGRDGNMLTPPASYDGERSTSCYPHPPLAVAPQTLRAYPDLRLLALGAPLVAHNPRANARFRVARVPRIPAFPTHPAFPHAVYGDDGPWRTAVPTHLSPPCGSTRRSRRRGPSRSTRTAPVQGSPHPGCISHTQLHTRTQSKYVRVRSQIRSHTQSKSARIFASRGPSRAHTTSGNPGFRRGIECKWVDGPEVLRPRAERKGREDSRRTNGKEGSGRGTRPITEVKEWNGMNEKKKCGENTRALTRPSRKTGRAFTAVFLGYPFRTRPVELSPRGFYGRVPSVRRVTAVSTGPEGIFMLNNYSSLKTAHKPP